MAVKKAMKEGGLTQGPEGQEAELEAVKHKGVMSQEEPQDPRRRMKEGGASELEAVNQKGVATQMDSEIRGPG